MVDLSHVAYRELIRSFGGCDLFYSEMLNSRMLPSETPDRSVYLKWAKNEDLVFQIVGNSPEKMAAAAYKLSGFKPWGIDINMGCWLKKVTCHGWGVALMKDMDIAGKVVRSVRASIDTPLSVKLRLGYTPDKEFIIDFVSMLESEGVDFIVLHPRTAYDGMKRRAKWEYIAFAKEAIHIPVIGNGDIRSPEDGFSMIKQTGCDGIMIGRQALIQPWIFRDIKSLMDYNHREQKPELKKVILDLVYFMEQHLPKDIVINRFRKAIPWLASNLVFGHFLVKELGKSHSLEELKKHIDQVFLSGIY